MPSVISAPNKALPKIPASNFVPERPMALPPPGPQWNRLISIKPAARISTVPIPICTLRRGHWLTTPAPNHAPTADAAIRETSVSGSTCTKPT